MKIQIVVIFCLWSFCLAGKVTPSFASHLTKKGLEYSKRLSIDILSRNLVKVTLPDHRGEVPVIQYEFWLRKMKITKFQVGTSITNFVPNQGISLRLTDVTMEMNFSWSYRGMIWPHISDGGTGVSILRNVEIAGDIQLYKQGRKLHSKSRNVALRISHLNVQLSGGTAPWLLNLFLPLFNGLIKGQIERESNHVVSVLINQELNKVLGSMLNEPLLIPGVPKIGIDWSLVSNPIFTTENMMVPHLGEFFQWGLARVPSNYSKPIVLRGENGNKMVNSLISNHMLVSLSETLYQLNAFVLEIRNNMLPDFSPIQLNTNEFRLILPNLTAMYPNAELIVKLVATESPIPSIFNGGGHVEFIGDMEWWVIVNSTPYLAFTFSGVMVCKGEVSLKNLNVMGNLSLLRFEYHLKQTNVGDFNVHRFYYLILILFEKGIIPQLNKRLLTTVALPSPHRLSLANEVIQYHDGYVDISADFIMNIN